MRLPNVLAINKKKGTHLQVHVCLASGEKVALKDYAALLLGRAHVEKGLLERAQGEERKNKK